MDKNYADLITKDAVVKRDANMFALPIVVKPKKIVMCRLMYINKFLMPTCLHFCIHTYSQLPYIQKEFKEVPVCIALKLEESLS